MRGWLLLVTLFSWATANAEVFKCVGQYGKTVYQSQPCKASQREKQLDIKVDPEQEAAAKARLQAVQAEYQARKEQQAKIENERLQKNYQAASLDAARRSAQAQQEQAEAQSRQADALERQNTNSVPLYVPAYGVVAPPIPVPPPPVTPSERSPEMLAPPRPDRIP